MAKTQVIEWKSFMNGEVKEVKVTEEKKKPNYQALATIAVTVLGGMIFAQGLALADPTAVPAMAPSFEQALSRATKPIKDLIFGFGHEIYGVFMAWGAIEVMIGKANQGFSRMKTSTLAYVLLWWVPFIVKQVAMVRPM